MLTDLDPILIAAPIQRSGTTLLQRLLSSSPHALIYGESCANDLNLLLGLWLQKNSMYGRGETWRAEQLENVLKGEVNDWIPDLMPDITSYLDHFEGAISSFLQFFAAFAQKQGRDHWGVKLPGWNTAQLEQILRLMPQTRIVYIVRDLEACVRSAKLIQFCQDLSGIQQFGQHWLLNLQEAQRRLQRKEVLWIAYQELVSEPQRVIEQLEHFTGVSGIDLEVMKHRINDYQQNLSEPPGLHADELALVAEIQQQMPFENLFSSY